MKKTIFFKIKNEVIEMSKTLSQEKINLHESNIMIEVGKGLSICALIIVFVLSFFWKELTNFVLLHSVFLLVVIIALDPLKNSSLKIKTKMHIISSLISLEYMFLYFLMYEKISFLFWLTLLLAIIPATVICRKLTFKYMVFTFAFTLFITLYENWGAYPKERIPFIIAFVFIYLLLITISYFIEVAFNIILTSKDSYIEKIDEQNKLIREKTEELYEIAYVDYLVELPNREATIEKLRTLVEEKNEFYLVYMDLDDFKSINDSLNHSYGDSFLKAFSERIKEGINKEDFLSRMGGDEFALIVNRNLSREEIKAYMEEILEKLKLPLKVEQYEMKIKFSLGITKFPEDAKTSLDLLKTADTAMYKAKSYKNTICFYKEEFGNEILEKKKIENCLVKALKRNEFRLVYQPILGSVSEKVISFESLIRWESKEFGNVPPNVFIPIAEQLGIIHDMGFFIIESAAKMAKKLEDNHYNAYITVNVSAIQLKNPDFIEKTRKIIEKTRVSSKCLVFEFTESTFIDNNETTKEVIRLIKDMGIRTAIDDFGTGYSSFGYLPKLPIDILKIDKIFVDEIGISEENNALLNAIISIGHIFKMKVVAEGVEEKEQLDYLKEIGCDLIQGYYFSKPIEERNVFNYLDEHIK